jgi:hypothetical protein
MTSLVANRQEAQKVLSKIVAQAWLDEEFKKRLISEPAVVLEENGLTIPSGLQVRVKENTSLEASTGIADRPDTNDLYEILLPPKPAELTDKLIQSWANGDTCDSPAPLCFYCD